MLLPVVSCAKDFNRVRELGMSKMKLFLIQYLVLSPETFPLSKKSCRAANFSRQDSMKSSRLQETFLKMVLQT